MHLRATTPGSGRWMAMALIAMPGVLAAPAHASVTRGEPRHGVRTDAFGAVGSLSHTDTAGATAGSAVAVLNGQHILTARHGVTAAGGILGDARDASGFRFQAHGVTYQGVELFADFGGDLAMIRLNGVVPGAFELWDRQWHGPEDGLTFQGVGFGATDPDGDGRWGPGGDGVKRTFANTIDQVRNGTIPGQGPVLPAVKEQRR